jgi:hypothetical protein
MNNNAALVYVGQGNTFEMRGSAELTGNWNENRFPYQDGNGRWWWMAGAAQVEGGIFRMSGDHASVRLNGTDCSLGAGGIHAYDGQVIMAGENAEVSYNATSRLYGYGGVYVENGSYFEMLGDHAKISWNQGGQGGGISLRGDEDKITTGVMSGDAAEVSFNEGQLGNSGSVGGVEMSYGQYTASGVKTRFTMSGQNAKISNNAGGYLAGGVWVDDSCVFTMEGGEIFGNKATGWGQTIAGGAGGGVKVAAPPYTGTFIMKSGTVYGYLGEADPLRNAVDGGDQTQGQYTAALAGAVSLPKGGAIGGVRVDAGTYGDTSETIRAP